MAIKERELTAIKEETILEFISNEYFLEFGVKDDPKETKKYVEMLRNWQNERDLELGFKYSQVWMFVQHKAGLLMYSRLEKGKI